MAVYGASLSTLRPHPPRVSSRSMWIALLLIVVDLRHLLLADLPGAHEINNFAPRYIGSKMVGFERRHRAVAYVFLF